MALTFYHMTPGPFAERCIITLRLKGASFDEIILDPASGETRTDAFLRLSPRGTLPVLQHDDLVVRESQAIMFYLDRALPGPMLYGDTPADGAAIMQAICDQGSYLEPLLKRVLGPLLFGKGPIDEVAGVDSALASEIKVLEQTLSGRPFITGRTLSAADINIFPLLAATHQCLAHPDAAGLANLSLDLLDNSPRLTEWMARMSQASKPA